MVSLTVFCGVTVVNAWFCGVCLRESLCQGSSCFVALTLTGLCLQIVGGVSLQPLPPVCVAVGGCAREVTDSFLSLSGRGKKRM